MRMSRKYLIGLKSQHGVLLYMDMYGRTASELPTNIVGKYKIVAKSTGKVVGEWVVPLK